MKIQTVSELLDEMHAEYLSMVGNGIILDKPIKYRSSPHEPTINIRELQPTHDFRKDRQMLAAINQRLRSIK